MNVSTPHRPTLVFGTGNRKKAGELVDLLAPWGIELKTLADFEAPLEVDESGQTFAENARLKATQQAKHLKQWVLADDSGLAVDALGGAPGVYSARYAGPSATDADNCRKLLAELADKVCKGRLSVRQTEELVRAAKSGKSGKSGKKSASGGGSAAATKSASTRDLEQRLQRRLGTKVEVKDREGKGELVVQYASWDELDRILDIIL